MRAKVSAMSLETTSIVVEGFGRQKVFPAVGRCIYCGAKDTSLGDEHIIPQALGGNMILPAASCRECEHIVGAQLEGRLLHKTKGMFAAVRLRFEFKSKRPKDRPKSLPYRVIGRDGVARVIDVPAKKVPRHWMAFITNASPGIIAGRGRQDVVGGGTYPMYDPSDFARLIRPGEKIQFTGSGTAGELARFLSKIAHATAVAAYGLESFDPWLQKFILGNDDCDFSYYVAGHENKMVDNKGEHSVSLGTWENDGLRIGARVRLFCKYGTPDYEVAVGRFKTRRE